MYRPDQEATEPLVLELFHTREVLIHCADVYRLRPYPPYLHAVLRHTVPNMEEVFVAHAGRLDIPKAALTEILPSTDRVILRLGATSFFSVFFSHYFADHTLTHEQVDENAPESGITLRSLFGRPAREYTRAGLEGLAIGTPFRPYPLMTNPLGVTGICRYRREDGAWAYLRRLRRRRVLAEIHTLDWSFSGLVEAHGLGGGRPLRPVADFFAGELEDEVFRVFPSLPLRVVSSRALGILFGPRHLYQPELVVLVDLAGVDPKAVESHEDFLPVGGDKIGDAKVCGMNDAGYRTKETFHAARELLVNYLRAYETEGDDAADHS